MNGFFLPTTGVENVGVGSPEGNEARHSEKQLSEKQFGVLESRRDAHYIYACT
jgi:hypothetical protein